MSQTIRGSLRRIRLLAAQSYRPAAARHRKTIARSTTVFTGGRRSARIPLQSVLRAEEATPIRRVKETDIEHVVRISNEAISRGESTYGPGSVTAAQMLANLFAVPQKFESYLYENEHGIVAWAGLTRFTEREIY